MRAENHHHSNCEADASKLVMDLNFPRELGMGLDLIVHQDATETKAPTHALHDHIVDAKVVVGPLVVVGIAVVVVVLNWMVVGGRVVVVVVLGQMVMVGRVVVVDYHHLHPTPHHRNPTPHHRPPNPHHRAPTPHHRPPAPHHLPPAPHPPPVAPTYPTNQSRTSKEGCDIDDLLWCRKGTQTTCH